MSSLRWWMRAAVPAAFLAVVTPAGSQGRLDARTMKRFGGAYMVDCSNVAGPKVTVLAKALVFLHGKTRIAGSDVRVSYSHFRNSPPPGYEAALRTRTPDGDKLLAVVYRDQTGDYITLDGGPKVRARIGQSMLGLKYRRCGAEAKRVAAERPPTNMPGDDAGVDAAGMLLDPEFKELYYKALGSNRSQDWLASLDGPTSPNSRVTVAGTEYVVINSCMMHDCGENNMLVLYSATGRTVYGKIYQHGSSSLIGAPPPEVARELEKLWKAEFRRDQ